MPYFDLKMLPAVLQMYFPGVNALPFYKCISLEKMPCPFEILAETLIYTRLYLGHFRVA
jgi:hypothetical protein